MSTVQGKPASQAQRKVLSQGQGNTLTSTEFREGVEGGGDSESPLV